MIENGNTLEALSADNLPVPVCRFAFDDGDVVVRETNESFEERLGSVERDESLTDIFGQLDSNCLRTALGEGQQFTVDGEDAAYQVDVTPPAESTDGYLVFSDVTDESAESSDAFREGIAVDHVASVVSHDLRNPLDVARARLQAAREFEEPEHFDHVEQAHERMERIIQDVLTLARGEDVVDPDETVELGAVAKQAWETVETNGASLTVEDELPTALADPDRISRLFENLFRNSVEHGTAGETDDHAVTVTVGELDTEPGFYVADDGPGIPADRRERVLEPGYSSDEHGTGLGLAIVARIADLHGWEITVTEADSGGARFELHGVHQQ
ncbi:His Kinase A (phospho-acceptor) domain-containing protein [Halovenus aranensis]|jgi:signal transduction histidine kinase|uniref:histidine kinase n=1 Tax=Halovenus aranensis TaxID=890420 RepID=A0A1G8S6G6_9EURY|nr:HAMP domain-containing sensor histidine kinase [Halovenus aranensis]SDJ24787.1 His Kinase A (phospho-acceptor) domain-containing protein [Halovenus aranensis]